MKKLILLLVSCLILTASTDAAPRQAVKTEGGTQLVLTDSISVAKKVKQSTKPKRPIEIHGGDAEDFITQLHDLFPEDKIWERTSFLLNPGEVSIPNLRLVTNTAEGVLKLYNRLAEVRPEWGEWLWEGEFKDAASIVLLEKKKSAVTPASVFQQRLRALTEDATAKKPRVVPSKKPGTTRLWVMPCYAS